MDNIEMHLKEEEKLHQAIGEYFVTFSSFEQLLTSTLAEFINEEDTYIARIVTSGLSYQKLLKAMRNVSEYKHGNSDIHHKLIEILSGAESLEQTRNTFVHSLWQYFPNQKMFHRYKIKAPKYLANKTITEEQLHSLEEIQEETSNIKKITDKLLLYFYSSTEE